MIMPWTAPTFYVYFYLSDGIGDGTLTLEIADAESIGNLHEAQLEFRLANPTEPARFVIPIRNCIFEGPGRYQATLFVDQEIVALTVFDVDIVED
jgi:Family of unknown function (DUF6941)